MNGAILFRKITDSYRPSTWVSDCNPLDKLTKFTDVARIGAVQEILA
jgi:hypothetical protein